MGELIFKIALVACTLVGCATASGRQGPAMQTSGTGQTGGKGQSAGGEVVVERMGGYAGVYERYEISLDGLLLGPRGVTRTLAPEMVAEFVDGIRKSGAFPESGVLRRWGLCSDCFCYRVTLRTGGAVKVYMFAEPLKANSAAEERILKSVRRFLSSLEGSTRIR